MTTLLRRTAFRHLALSALAALNLMAPPASAADLPPGYAGQQGWLFYRNEGVEDAKGSAISLGLIARLQAQLLANGTQTMVALVPIKARIYADYLPPDGRLSPTLSSQYERFLASLKGAGVTSANLNAAFLNHPSRNGEFPFFMRQDTHWSSGGALLAAQTIQSALLASRPHQQALEATPPAPYSLTWSTQRWPRLGDLVGQRGPGAPQLEPEAVSVFEVQRGASSGASLMGDAPEHGITLLGSSYSADWTQFPAALRFALQRDLLSISVTADQGQWAGLESYLRDDAFQTRRPGLLIWEMPERDIKSPPAYPYREARYVMDNDEWLLRASAWVQQACAASPHQVNIEPTGLAKGATVGSNPTALRVRATQDTDYIELRFSPAVDRLDYLSARISSNGSKAWRMEASGPAGTAPRRWTQTVAGDDGEHVLKMPVAVAAAGQGYTRLKIFPGKTAGLSWQAGSLCRQPAGLLD